MAIQFDVETLPKVNFEDLDENQITLEELQETIKEKELWQEPIENFNFSQEQYDELFSCLSRYQRLSCHKVQLVMVLLKSCGITI